MLRLLLLFILSAASSFAFAADAPPSLFDIAEEDVSLYYLGAVFGSQMISTGTDMHLMSYLFEVFNTVCLSVGLIIIIYTVIIGVLETAGKGKVLGEKWSATWLPVRMVLGMSLLAPVAGSGYCMAQYLVMWMVLQGVGAADTLWSKALDYFMEGGAVYSNIQGQSNTYMNTNTLDSTYSIERYVLVNAACIGAHNTSEYEKVYGRYQIYSSDDHKSVNFGDPKAWENGTGGQECGAILMPIILPDPDNPENDELILETYNNAFYNMARSLKDAGEYFASEDGADYEQWVDQRSPLRGYAATFIEYLKGAHDILYPEQTFIENPMREALKDLKKYGWLLAGNYYMTLASFNDAFKGIRIIVPDTLVEDPGTDASDRYKEAITNAQEFWKLDVDDPRHTFTFDAWGEEKYKVPGYQEEISIRNYGLTKEKMQEIDDSLKQLGSVEGTRWGTLDVMDPLYYLDRVGGFDNEFSQDPILSAAQFGKELTEVAVYMIFAYMGLMLLGTIAYAIGWVPCAPGNAITLPLILVIFTAPIVFGVAAFIYLQGALLGVLLPLIPSAVFFIGAVGWFFGVFESMVAAPLVAIGIIFPETNQDIWGKAEPAYMMILNLFLRPSLMIIGFVLAMIFTWIAVEILNAAFYLFIKDAAQIENMLFGALVITLVYAAALVTIVAKAFSLINEMPNKTLSWIGDRTQAQEGAAEMISTVRGGAEKGGAAAGGVMTAAGGLSEKAAQMKMTSEAQKRQEDAARNRLVAGPD